MCDTTAIVAGTLYISLPVSRLGVLLGDSSYALYLSHLFTLGALRAVLPDFNEAGPLVAWGITLASVLACIAAGIVVHFVIDNWLLRQERLDVFRAKG